MALVYTITALIVCKICGREEVLKTHRSKSLKVDRAEKLRLIARSLGWIARRPSVHKPVDICPQCRDKGEPTS